MIVDSSALVEIALGKAGAEALMVVLALPAPKRISAGNLLESYMVIDRRGFPESAMVLDDTIRRAALMVEPVTEAQVAIARDAWRRYGRGSGHPARLNYGDCFAYALARERNEPLLFIGNDFAQTDVTSALDLDTDAG
jgi:ribonuclease VapC